MKRWLLSYLLTIILTQRLEVTLINPILSEGKWVGLELTIPMMYHTWVLVILLYLDYFLYPFILCKYINRLKFLHERIQGYRLLVTNIINNIFNMHFNLLSFLHIPDLNLCLQQSAGHQLSIYQGGCKILSFFRKKFVINS